MKIETVKIKEFKILKNIESEIKGRDIFIIGDNEVGKSSFTQFIRIALGDQSNIPPNATGEGIVIASKNGNNYTFKVKFKDGKPVVEVASPDGLKDTKKGTLLSLTGISEFDITEFVLQSKSAAGQKKQVEFYKSLFDIEIIKEIDTLQAKVKSLETERTETGREEKRLKAVIESHPLRNEIELTKFKEVDTAALLDSLNKANEKNKSIEGVTTKLTAKKAEVDDCDSQIAELKKSIAAYESKKEFLLVDIEKGKAWLETNKPIDTADIQTQINEASETNKKAAQAAQLIKDREAHALAAEEYGTATANIHSQKAAIELFIKELAVPVDGLMFDEDMLVYNGIPVSEASLSTSQIEELGFLIKVAENKDFGILFLGRAESIGIERLKKMQQIAKDNNMQLIAEEVRRGEDFTIEIMEG